MEAMKKMGVVINLALPAIKWNGRKLNVLENKNGHLIEKVNINQEPTKMDAVLVTTKWDQSELKKLHKRFGHASNEKLRKLLENSKTGMTKRDKKNLEEVTEACEECFQEKQPGRRNKQTIYRSGDFNETIAIELTEWFDRRQKQKIIICHMIDEFTRLSSAVIIPNKKPESILKARMMG